MGEVYARFQESLNQDIAVWVIDKTMPLVGADVGGPFKALMAIHDFHPEISYATIVAHESATTVLWRSPPMGGRVKAFSSLEEIESLDVYSSLKYTKLLVPVSEGAIFLLIGHSVNPDMEIPAGSKNWEGLFSEPEANIQEYINKEILKAMEGYKLELENIKLQVAALAARQAD